LDPRFIFYGGKGGVGKTTCAAARAVAEAAGGARVLVASTDPAHSLGDALGVRLSSRPAPLRLVGRGPGLLHAVELDAPRAFARWLKEHRRPLAEILEHGTWLDPEDVEALLDLSMPGVDELVGLIEIARLANARLKPRATEAARDAVVARGFGRVPPVYDLVVVDTAPTGHTLRLLAAPETVAAVAAVLDGLQQEHRLIREQLARVGRPEAADRLIALLAEQARETAARLRDPKQTAFHWVTLPEELSLAESGDAIAALERSGIRVADIVVNRVLPDAGPCPVCDRRRADERRVVASIRRRLGRGRRLRVVPAALREPRGLAALARIGRQMADRSGVRAGKPSALSPRPSMRAPAFSTPEGARTLAPDAVPAFRGASLLFFGGKGGVGKTTVAAATAERLARAHPRRRVLLLSTDPAHSIADVFGVAPGRPDRDDAHRIPGAPKNLDVRELDAQRAFAARRAQFESALDEIASAVGADALSAGGKGASQLMNLAPPGTDELFGILSVVDARDDYDVIVIDTAPTGHALRLLEMPAAAREWMQVLLRMLLKYRSLVRPGQLAAELVDVSKSIRALQTLLRDHAHTRFIVVTRAADVPRRETDRLLARLGRLGLATPAIIVNAMTLLPGRCARCRAAAADEHRELLLLQQRVRRAGGRLQRCVIILTPLSAPPPRGVDALERWAGKWIVEAP
jgi:arsenite-transporting ATPase